MPEQEYFTRIRRHTRYAFIIVAVVLVLIFVVAALR